MSSMNVVRIYSKPACPQCSMTYKRLEARGIPFEVVDITEHPAALEYVTEDLGYLQAPVVFIEDGTGQNHWSGFRPDKIDALEKN